MVEAKPHCGTDCELLERKELGCLIDASESDPALRSSSGRLVLTRPSTTIFALGHKPQRLKGAGALVVVFEQESINGQFVEQTFRNGVVATFSVPVTAIVAAAEMDGESDAGLAGGREAGVVGVERGGQHLRGIDAQFLLHPRSPLGIEIVAVAWRVDLQIGDAAGGERADVLGHDGGDGV